MLSFIRFWMYIGVIYNIGVLIIWSYLTHQIQGKYGFSPTEGIVYYNPIGKIPGTIFKLMLCISVLYFF